MRSSRWCSYKYSITQPELQTHECAQCHKWKSPILSRFSLAHMEVAGRGSKLQLDSTGRDAFIAFNIRQVSPTNHQLIGVRGAPDDEAIRTNDFPPRGDGGKFGVFPQRRKPHKKGRGLFQEGAAGGKRLQGAQCNF